MSVVLNTTTSWRASETLASGGKLVSDRDENLRLHSSSVPAVSKYSGGLRQLAAGADTIDLTAIPNEAGGAVDFTGLKVQAVYIKPLIATSRIVFANGASSGYALFAATSGKIDIAQGEVYRADFNESRPDVASGAKTIDVTSADVDAIYEILIAAG